MNEPVVTVIVLHWRTPDMTRACLQALYQSDYSVMRVLLIDNGSFDGVARALAYQFPSLHILELPCNRGFAAAVNIAIRHALAANSAYVWLLNNDVLIYPDTLRQLVAIKQQHPQLGLLTPLPIYPDRPQQVAGIGLRIAPFDVRAVGWNASRQAYDPAEPIMLDAVFATAMLVDTAVFRQIGLFDEQFFFYYEDADLCLRARQAGIGCACTPAVVVTHDVAATARRVRGLRDFHLAYNRQLFFRKHWHGWRLAVYVVLESLRVLREINNRLRRASPADALAYASGTLQGLLWGKPHQPYLDGVQQ